MSLLLSILGTNLLSATVWNVDGAPATNGVAIADLLCTNGVAASLGDEPDMLRPARGHHQEPGTENQELRTEVSDNGFNVGAGGSRRGE